ncbi:unnamed protein product [Penicillium palitans]
MAPASGWRRDHLLACRVTVRQTRPYILPILDQYSESSDATSPVEIRNFVNGPESVKHLQKTLAAFKDDRDAQRTHQSNGPSNSNDGSHYEESNADSDVSMDTESDGDSKARSTRARRARQETPDETTSAFVPSGTMQVASSSPRAESSHSASSTGYIENAEHQLRITVEDGTLRLASCVIRHILYFGAPQDQPNMSGVVEFRDAKLRSFQLPRLLEEPMKATDDGGICLRTKNRNNEFKLENDRVAILEAKRRFQWLEEGKPTIADECLAQMTCEALLARLVGSDPRESVIVIHATQHYLCFLQFEISDEYIRNFGSNSLSSCIHVTATPWYDHGSESNRKQIVLNLCAIMRWGGAKR